MKDASGQINNLRLVSASDACTSPCDTDRMRVVGLHHVQLAMPPGEEATATAFYQELLGIPRVPKPAHLEARGGCWFENDEVRIHLGVEHDFRPARKAHPALIVEDLDALRARLANAGVSIDDDEPLPGFERCYVSDPFGNRIELLTQN
jgi:catechol 2,3-dioxygenase-like lactoylglutathione lyase family enzyme